MATNVLQKYKKQAQKLFKKFGNYTKNQQWFVLYLFVLSIFLLCFPLISVNSFDASTEGYHIWLFSSSYLKSMIIILVSLLILFGWNLSSKFKNILISFLGVRESEPLINFSFIWIITSVFMGIVDTVSVAQEVSSRISLTGWAIFDQVLLLVGLVLAFIAIWKSSKTHAQKTKIMNVVTDESQKSTQQKKTLKHLFDEEDE